MGGSYKDLRVWKFAMELVFRIYDVTESFPNHELYGLISQMRKAAVSVVSNIAEGKGRTSKKELAHFLSNARGSVRELETQVLICAHLTYVAPDVERDLLKRIDDIGRMLAGLMDFATEESA